MAEGFDLAVQDADVGAVGGGAGAVYDGAVGEDEVEGGHGPERYQRLRALRAEPAWNQVSWGWE